MTTNEKAVLAALHKKRAAIADRLIAAETQVALLSESLAEIDTSIITITMREPPRLRLVSSN